MEIARALPHRTVQSVYRHGLRQLHPFKRGGWTDEECTELHNLVQIHGKKWAIIQNKLNRSADSCRDKYREMPKEYIKGRWRLNETARLIKISREQLKLSPLKMTGAEQANIGAMKAAPDPEDAEYHQCGGERNDQTAESARRKNESTNGQGVSAPTADELNSQRRYLLAEVIRINAHCEHIQIILPWSVISKRMVNRSRLSCFKKWQKMTGGGDDVSTIADDDVIGFVTAPAPSVEKIAVDVQAASGPSQSKSSKKKSNARSKILPKAADSDSSQRTNDPNISSTTVTGTSTENEIAEGGTEREKVLECAASKKSGVSSTTAIQTSSARPKKRDTAIDAPAASFSDEEAPPKKPKVTKLRADSTKVVSIAALPPTKATFIDQKEFSGSTRPSASIVDSLSADEDTLKLLDELSHTDALRHTDIDWAGLSHTRAFARWSEVLDMIELENDADPILDANSLSEQALILLNRCKKQDEE